MSGINSVMRGGPTPELLAEFAGQALSQETLAELAKLEQEQAQRREHRWRDFAAFVGQVTEHKHEPPPVGAEVSYEVALEDMKRRPEARYRERPEASELTSWRDGAQWFGRRKCLNEAWNNQSFKWTRDFDDSEY